LTFERHLIQLLTPSSLRFCNTWGSEQSGGI
jgi:hypothetical protein